ncbi:E3 ubiquitin-protein ligase TRIM39-like [Periophthalmus magnuspinnatus]|uniref:E3 ubiquitin-protein ligase TRIM39-like n=1 Tax=Periophthalmus magnuspinnatus TaxID=409849 RepID=UPI00145A233E|nr:E3 ubiquitin-protein ligase TRIM39-like [Periophthalmus magnuspinnatus]
MPSTLEDLCCPICHDIFKDPVILNCTHNFCRACVESEWRTKPRKCPLCSRRHSKHLPPDIALRNECEVLLRQRTELESVCKLHNEDLTLFCRNHLQPVCLNCRDTEQHNGHTIRPIKKEAPIIRKKLEEKLKPLKDKIQELSRSKQNFLETAFHIKTQGRLSETRISEHFQRLHQFLEKEQQNRIQAVREEEEQKIKSLEDKMAEIGKEIQALSEIIASIEKQLEVPDISILLKYKATVKKIKHCPLMETPKLGSGALIDQAKHLGNLDFNIWNNMKNLVEFYPVILDPNTAHPELTLSEDLTSVKCVNEQQIPDIPERFTSYYRVLGSEGFSCGNHSWEVEVSGKEYWSVGVVSGSVQRKGKMDAGNWEIYFINGNYKVVSRPDTFILLDVQNLSRVRVNLDCDKGTLSFHDADTDMCLYTFTECLSESLFPCFLTYNTTPLKVSPSKSYFNISSCRL